MKTNLPKVITRNYLNEFGHGLLMFLYYDKETKTAIFLLKLKSKSKDNGWGHSEVYKVFEKKQITWATPRLAVVVVQLRKELKHAHNLLVVLNKALIEEFKNISD